MTHKIANQFNMVGEELVHVVGDFHIYNNHQEQVALQLTREPLPAPTVKFNFPVGTHILDVDYKDIEICGYTSHPAILAPIAK